MNRCRNTSIQIHLIRSWYIARYDTWRVAAFCVWQSYSICWGVLGKLCNVYGVCNYAWKRNTSWYSKCHVYVETFWPSLIDIQQYKYNNTSRYCKPVLWLPMNCQASLNPEYLFIKSKDNIVWSPTSNTQNDKKKCLRCVRIFSLNLSAGFSAGFSREHKT